jgi:hypothetical protein
MTPGRHGVRLGAEQEYRSVPRGLSDCGSAAQPYREAVVGVLECDVDVELMDNP